MTSLLDIKGSFDGETVFLTGFTGFVGKALTEKLLRSCSNIKRLYVLIREKKGKSTTERADEVLSDEFFSVLEKHNPQFRRKITPIPGDSSLPQLGLSPEHRRLLINEVGIVFHGAATVRFDEEFKIAFKINVRGTREMLDLAREMVRLKAFVHVSTAFTYCLPSIKHVDEKLYECPFEADKFEEVLNSLDDNTVEVLQHKILGDWPNTYTFTKAIAEHLVNDYGKGIPRIVFRPAVVVGTDKEPLFGWTDNIYGPSGIVIGAGFGVIHTFQVNTALNANLVPVDYVVNALLAAAAAVVQDQPKNNEDVKIYNYVSSADNPLTWKEFKQYIEINGSLCPPIKSVWSYFFITCRMWTMYFICGILFHYIPALLMDTVTYITRAKNPNMFKIYRKIEKFNNAFLFFTLQEWDFTNGNVHSLLRRVVKEDEAEFYFDIAQVDWTRFFFNYIRGLRVYFVKDGLETIPAAQIRWNRFIKISRVIKYVGIALLLRFAWSLTSPFLMSW